MIVSQLLMLANWLEDSMDEAVMRVSMLEVGEGSSIRECANYNSAQVFV